MITRLIIVLLCGAGWISAAHAHLCAARSGRNARAVMGCPSLGVTALLTESKRADKESDSAALVLDTQFPLGPVLVRVKGLLNSDDNVVEYGAAAGVAWLGRIPIVDIMVNLGGEYAVPLAETVQQTLTLPSLQRYFAPDTHQFAAQASLGYVGGGPFGIRFDADYVWMYPDIGDRYRNVQVGGTVAYDVADFLGFRMGYDHFWVERDGALEATRNVITPGLHYFSTKVDVGANIAVARDCPKTNDCEPEVFFVIDLTLPLGRF